MMARWIDAVHTTPGCKCAHTFVCNVCGRVCGWCYGAADSMPRACDDCWCKKILATGGGR